MDYGLGQQAAHGQQAAPPLRISPPGPPPTPATISGALQGVTAVVTECLQMAWGIRDRIAGPQPSGASEKQAAPPNGLAGTTMELAARAQLLRQELESILTSL